MRKSMWSYAGCALLILALQTGGCPDDGATPDPGTMTDPTGNGANDSPMSGSDDDPGGSQGATATGAARAMIRAATGGTVRGSTGLELTIPPGALASDTEIALTPLSDTDLAALDASYLAGAVLEPDGLEFSQPATLRVPLPAPWEHEEPPFELVFKGTDPSDAFETDRRVGLSADGRFALFEVEHFSGRICANQCHAGVREVLEAHFAAEGCARADWFQRVQGKYPGLELRESCESIAPSELVAILDSMFDEYGEWNAGDDVPADKLAELEQIAESGRQVVFVFSNDSFSPRGGERNFYGGVAHSAIAEKREGAWQMRNTFVPGYVAKLFPDGTNVVWWPLRDLNTFRNLAQGVAVEIAFCGQPGCLGSDDPYDTTKPYTPLERRVVSPWDAVRIFVEREQNVACQRLAGCWRFATEGLSDSGTFLLRFDERGQVDSLWMEQVNDGSIETSAATVFFELMRFARPNAGAFADNTRGVDAGVFPAEDQSEFTAALNWEFVFRDEGEISSTTEYFMAFNSAELSKNEPGEYFDCDFEQVITYTSYDEDGNMETDEQRFAGRLRAARVPCPEPGAEGVYTQEQLPDLFDFDFDLCGTGAGMTAPLTIAGLLTLRPRRPRRATRG